MLFSVTIFPSSVYHPPNSQLFFETVGSIPIFVPSVASLVISLKLLPPFASKFTITDFFNIISLFSIKFIFPFESTE